MSPGNTAALVSSSTAEVWALLWAFEEGACPPGCFLQPGAATATNAATPVTMIYFFINAANMPENRLCARTKFALFPQFVQQKLNAPRIQRIPEIGFAEIRGRTFGCMFQRGAGRRQFRL